MKRSDIIITISVIAFIGLLIGIPITFQHTNGYFAHPEKYSPLPASEARFWIVNYEPSYYDSIEVNYYCNSYDVFEMKDDNKLASIVMHGWSRPGNNMSNEMHDEDLKLMYVGMIYDRVSNEYVIRKYIK